MQKTVHTIAELRARIAAWKQAGERVAFVPTMGNLHRGHIHLVERARELAPRTVASIFVNPMQFGANEDYAGYPRTLEDDSRQLEAVGLDLLFAPKLTEVYPRPLADMAQVTVPELSAVLCGVSRPIHFSGVTTVVTKLFNMVQPDAAWFGQKDAQQCAVIRRMARDLDLSYPHADAIHGVPTVREADGLAMSSRNQYLSAEERQAAATLPAAMRAALAAIAGGTPVAAALDTLRASLLAAGFSSIDYADLADAASLERVTVPGTAPARLLVAARLGSTRLIDNMPLG